MTLEFVGFSSRHMIAVIKHKQFHQIPRECILKRWMIYARPNIRLNEISSIFYRHVTNSRYTYLMSLFITLCLMAYKEDMYYKETMDCVQKLWFKYKQTKVEEKSIGTATPLKFNGIRDPDVVSIKGHKKEQSLRKCDHCGIRGHNKHKCPQLYFGNDIDSNACEFHSLRNHHMKCHI